MKFEYPANANELFRNVSLPFMLESSGIRGRFIRLNEELHKILSNHKYPERTSQMLGELLVLASMLGSILKLKDGMVTIQAQGDGALAFLSADYNSKGHLRGYAHMNDKEYMRALGTEKSRKKHNIKEIFGKGYIVITIEHKGEKPYQAIVPLEGKSLTSCIMDYFQKSDQLEATIEVAVSRINKKWHAGGILLQKIAREGGHKKHINEEDWDSANIFLGSVSDKELIDDKLPPNTLLYRLFNEHGVRVFDPSQLEARCRCSRNRMLSAIKSLTKEELEKMKVRGVVTVTCHFCKAEEKFKDGDL